jgi:type VI secretion system protein ImpF
MRFLDAPGIQYMFDMPNCNLDCELINDGGRQMKSSTPGLFDRLLDMPVRSGSGAAGARAALEDLKDAVARDLEALLNTRTALDEDALKQYPECGRSILTYGLGDFAGLSLSSPDDRAHICRCLESAIAQHEPRLRKVQAVLEPDGVEVNRLNFSIKALLVVSTSQEMVNFDAVLTPSSLRYSINKSAPAARS